MQILDQDGEFVTTHPASRVRGADRSPEPSPDFDQQIVAGRMPQAVIDLLETIKINDHHRERFLLTRCPGQGVPETVRKQYPVDQSRQSVVGSLVSEVLLAPLDLCRHRVEQLGELAEFVPPLYDNPVGQIPRAEEPGRLPQALHRP